MCACVCVSKLLNHFTVRKSELLFLSLCLNFPELAPAMDNKGSRSPPAVLLSLFFFFFFFFFFFTVQLNQDERRKRGEQRGEESE